MQLRMLYQFNFRPYHRRFKQPLQTSHGIWDVREGIILRLSDETGRVGWGEIAPIPWFGSETFEQAWEFCQQLPPKITIADILSIPAELPACQFGFESAWEQGSRGAGEAGGAGEAEGDGEKSPITHYPLPTSQSKIQNRSTALRQAQEPRSRRSPKSKIPYSCLLPTGKAALQAWQTSWNRGHRTFKWKIGVAVIADELEVFDQLIQSLPQSVQLRLDANGGLTQQEAHHWLKVCDQVGRVEFLEQPLPPKQFNVMLEMCDRYSTPIALDESVATLDQLEECYQRGWGGIFVIKAAIAGSPKRLRQFCQTHDIDTVFSSVFETAIAKQAALQLAAELSRQPRAVGFGVNCWFDEEDETFLKRLWNIH